MSGTGEKDQGAFRRLDLVAGAVMAALAPMLFFWFIPTFAPGESGPGQIAPSFFPRFSIAVVFFCAIVIIARSLKTVAVGNTGEGRQLIIEIAGWSTFAITLFVLLRWAGFVPAGIFSVLSGVVLTRYRENLLLVGFLAVGLPILLDYAVWALFQIELP